MKKLKSVLLILLAIITVVSCSGIKVTDAWKADEIGDIKEDNILVIVRTDDMVSRQRFEQEIADKVREGGNKATESYKKFPGMKHNVKRTEEEVDQMIQIIKNEGFGGVVLTVLKDVSSEIVTSETGGYTAGGFYPSSLWWLLWWIWRLLWKSLLSIRIRLWRNLCTVRNKNLYF